MSSAYDSSNLLARPHTKRGRHSTASSLHSNSASVQAHPLHHQSHHEYSQPRHQQAAFAQSGSSDEDDYERGYSKLSVPSAAYSLPAPLPYSYSSSLSSSPLYSPTSSPLSPGRDARGCSASSSYSSSPLSSSQLASSSSPAPYGDMLERSPEQSLKRLCVNNAMMDVYAESAEEEASHSHRAQHSHRQQQQPALPTSSSFSHSSHTYPLHRVLVKAKRNSNGSPSASVTPYQSPPSSRPSTAASSTIRASFNLSEPSTDYAMPANSAPTSTHASPQPSAASSPQTRYTTLLSSSLPSGAQSFLSLLNVSCASANSSFSSPAHSPSGGGFPCASQQATPSSTHSSASFRPHILSAQQRAALFPSRSVTSSPTPLDGHSGSSSTARRTSTGKRSGMDPPALASAAIDVSRRASDGGRHSRAREGGQAAR